MAHSVNGASMDAMSGEAFELEAKRKDGSWHPCRVSLSSSYANCDIVVGFESCEEEIISNKEDALARLRFRSIPLQVGDCAQVKEGESVLAMHMVRSKSLLFDAIVEKAHKVRHSNRVHCRCTFAVKWLASELTGKTTTIASYAIMKLSDQDIGSHPVLTAFLTALDRTNAVETSSFLNFFENATCEPDLQLEKQIEEISKLADESECSGNFLSGVKRANLDGNTGSCVVAPSLNLLNNQSCKISASSQTEQQLEMELKKHLHDAPVLSPLAARAALASLVREQEPKPAFLICQSEREGHMNLPQKDPKKHINRRSLDVKGLFVDSDAYIRKTVFSISDSNQNSEFETLDEAINIPGSSGPLQKDLTKKSQCEESPNLLTLQEKPAGVRKEIEGKKLDSPTIAKHKRNLVTDGKLSGHRVTTRLTRSTSRKEILNSTAEVSRGSSHEDFTSPVSSRSTRNTEQKARKNEKLKQELSKSGWNQDVEDLVTPEKKESKESISLSVVTSLTEEDQGVNLPVNLTRNAEQKPRKEANMKGVPSKTSLNQDMEHLVTPQKKQRKESVSSSVNTERKKRTRASSVTSLTEEDQAVNPQNVESCPAVKKNAVSSKKPQLRFSPRLKFLPRTRSQAKSLPSH